MGSAGLVLALALGVAVPVVAVASDAGGDGGGDLAPLASSLLPFPDPTSSTRDDGIALRVSHGENGIELEGRFAIGASPAVAWSVLTDYDGIERFVHSMRESRVTYRDADSVYVDQLAVGRMFLFSRRLHTELHIHEEPPRRVLFEDALGRDFRSYRGEWEIESTTAGAIVTYELEADPSFPIPEFVARGLIRSAARELLAEVRTEIERRAAPAAR